MNFCFPKTDRILKRKHFKEINRNRNRFCGKAIFIAFRKSERPALGITVFRQFGNAILRNRFKRLVREAFRQSKHKLAPFEMNISPVAKEFPFSVESIALDLLEFSYAQSPTAKSS